jgi:Tfp pilus assembly protein PilF
MSSKRKKNVFPAKGIPSKPVAAASPGPPAGAGSRWAILGVCVFLAAAVWFVFGQTLHFGFINFDDDLYVYENAAIIHGLSWGGIAWLFTHTVSFNWHPLTMLTHMLDCQFYGPNAGGHHLTNVLLHTASVILLFLVLRDMTGALWRSAFVAAVFAVHPLHVESVVWVAERKDVLSGLFFMLTLWAYVRYVRQLSWRRYLLIMLAFALGLMSKPMLVTLPFVLLLLDYWPLGRFENPNNVPEIFSVPRNVILEKIPLLVLAAAGCVATVLSQHNAIIADESLPLALRIENAALSCVVYLQQMFYPAKLAVLYPLPANGIQIWKFFIAVMLLAAISGGVFVWRKKRPFMLVGWLWYLGMLVPVIGLVQVGAQMHADRYTYLPQIGLYLMITWMLAELAIDRPKRRLVLCGLAMTSIVGLAFPARLQASYWKTSELLWTHTLACTANNDVAHNNLGVVLAGKGRVDEGIIQFQKALAIKPDFAKAHYNLGSYLLQKERVDEAIVQFQKALASSPDFTYAHNMLGYALLQKRDVDAAMAQFHEALKIRPDYAQAHRNLGIALIQKGQMDEGILHLQKALVLQPGLVEAQSDLTHIAWIMATSPDASVRNGTKAVELARQTDRLSGGKNPVMAATLAAAYAEAGKFGDAIATAQHALQLAAGQTNATLVATLEAQLKLYQAGSPFHDTGASR